ncbi:positive regulator of CheA protein activity [Lachnospiraceae bacterium KM106-2]|nr:positive regulator of CheA protein activity [Lachnospiraceae bacterium KM106-2]
MAVTKQVLFHVGNELYGIDIAKVKGIEKYGVTTPVPNAPSYIEGIINLRGDVIPIFSLRAKFNLPARKIDDKTQMIIVSVNDMLVAFVVDDVSEIVELNDDAFSNTPVIVQSEETSYIEKIANVNKQLVITINVEGVFSEVEKESMKSLVKQEA